MDEKETSATTISPRTNLDTENKSKIVSCLSDVIKIVVNDGVLNIEDAVAPGKSASPRFILFVGSRLMEPVLCLYRVK